jgi:hypothetical protein
MSDLLRRTQWAIAGLNFEEAACSIGAPPIIIWDCEGPITAPDSYLAAQNLPTLSLKVGDESRFANRSGLRIPHRLRRWDEHEYEAARSADILSNSCRECQS